MTGISRLDRIRFSKGDGLLREGEFNAELHLAIGEAMELFANRKCQVEFHSDIFGRGEDVLADLILDGGPDLRKMALYSSAHSSTPSRRLVDAVASVLDAPLLENDESNLYEQCLALVITGAFAAQSEAELQAKLYEWLVRFEEHLVGDARDQAYLAGLSNTQRPEAAERIMEFAQNTEDAHTLEAAIDFVGAVAQPIARELLLECLESEAGQANRGAVAAALATQRLPHDARIDEVLSGSLFDYAEGSSWEARVEAARYFSADVETADISALRKLLNEIASLDPDKRVRNFVTHTLKKLDQ